jgi:sugar phosphate isomerase/epimerase
MAPLFWVTGETIAMINRREFLQKGALGMAAAAVAARMPSPLLANPLGKPIGLELYTLRDQLEKDLLGTVKQVAAIGYKEVELYSLHGKTPAEFATILKDNRLTAPSGHYRTADLRSNWGKHIDDAKTMGLEYMVNAILEPEERKTFDDYKRLAELFNKAGEQTQKAGIQYCYHNHNFEFKKYGDTTAYDYLLGALDPKAVNFEMDCFWLTHAGQDPVAYFEKHPGRFPLLHIKDMKDEPAPTQELDAKLGLFAPVGHGTIDWKRIFAAAPTGGVKHFFVEQDYCEGPPIEAARLSYEYLHGLT